MAEKGVQAPLRAAVIICLSETTEMRYEIGKMNEEKGSYCRRSGSRSKW